MYQAQLFVGGKASFVHLDNNLSQFLVFLPDSGSIMDTQLHNHGGIEKGLRILPFLQINDFNQGRFLTRSIKNNQTCPFELCTKPKHGLNYYSPERFLGNWGDDCALQTDAVDTFSLGGIFYYLLSNGSDPRFTKERYRMAIREKNVHFLPDNYATLEELVRPDPASIALMEVMIKCMALKMEDRHTVLDIVQILEEKVKMFCSF